MVGLPVTRDTPPIRKEGAEEEAFADTPDAHAC
jgi:hypothetical protein